MPSPLAHAAMGYFIARTSRDVRHAELPFSRRKLRWVLLISIAFSLLPDLDSIIGIVFGDFARFHNNATHSLISGLLIALLFSGLVWWRYGTLPRQWFFSALAAYELHVMMDYFTVSRGVMLIWPISAERFNSSISLFYGLHWSDGWLSARHLWTLATESLFALPLIWIARRLPSADQSVRPTTEYSENT